MPDEFEKRITDQARSVEVPCPECGHVNRIEIQVDAEADTTLQFTCQNCQNPLNVNAQIGIVIHL